MLRLVVNCCLVSFALGATVSKNGPISNGPLVGLQGDPVDMTSGGGGTYPRANFLNDGSLIGAFTSFPEGNRELTLVRSTDNGDSWYRIGSAATRPGSESDLDNPYPLQLPSGRVLLAFRNHDRDSNTGVLTWFRIIVCYSDDNGANWLYLSTPAEMGGPGPGLWEPILRNAQDGSLQIYYSKENGADDQDTMMRVSYDGGVSWGPEITISGQDRTARDGMTGVTTIDGSNLIAVFETTEDGFYTINSITSGDDGRTWGNRRRVYTATGDRNDAGAPQVINVGGTLVVSFQTNEDTQQPDGFAAKLVVSRDGGNSWGDKIEVFRPHTLWPGMVVLDDNSFLLMADNGGAKSQRITL